MRATGSCWSGRMPPARCSSRTRCCPPWRGHPLAMCCGWPSGLRRRRSGTSAPRGSSSSPPSAEVRRQWGPGFIAPGGTSACLFTRRNEIRRRESRSLARLLPVVAVPHTPLWVPLESPVSRRALFLPLCALLACAHSQPAPPPSTPASVVLSSEATAAMTRAWMAQNAGDAAKGHAELRQVWDQGHQFEEVARAAAGMAAAAGDTAMAITWLERALDKGLADPAGLLRAKALAPLRTVQGYDALVERARKNALEARRIWGVGDGLERSSPKEAGLSEPALTELLKAAEQSGSGGLVLLRHGKLVGEWYFGGETHRIEAMSATKGMVALAIGLLVDEGKIPSVDTPVSAFFPEWKDGLKGKVTLKHLLSHTSGLAANRTAFDIYESKDFVRYALDSEVVDEPGSKHAYNNKATNLIAGIVERASGEKMDVYLSRKLFTPLGIRDFRWDRDPSGNPVGMAGLQLHPVDFAKVGQMLLQGGTWQGKRILSASYIQALGGAPSHPRMPTAGLLWCGCAKSRTAPSPGARSARPSWRSWGRPHCSRTSWRSPPPTTSSRTWRARRAASRRLARAGSACWCCRSTTSWPCACRTPTGAFPRTSWSSPSSPARCSTS